MYSWRIDPDLKSALEEAARSESTSIARLLERIVRKWLEKGSLSDSDEKIQLRLLQAASKSFGTIHGHDPDRAEQASRRIRSKLRRRRAG